jgi:hypothetical protein
MRQMSAHQILAIAEDLIQLLERWGHGSREEWSRKHDLLRDRAMDFPDAELLRRLEKAFRLLEEGQLVKGKQRLVEARLLRDSLAQKIQRRPA